MKPRRNKGPLSSGDSPGLPPGMEWNGGITALLSSAFFMAAQAWRANVVTPATRLGSLFSQAVSGLDNSALSGTRGKESTGASKARGVRFEKPK